MSIDKIDKQKWIALLDEAIVHYERMIDFARKQPPTDIPTDFLMWEQMQEDWFSGSCPLCQAVDRKCQECILAKEYMPCSPEDERWSSSEWAKMHTSKTWEEWLIHATALRDIMVKIREKLEKKVAEERRKNV